MNTKHFTSAVADTLQAAAFFSVPTLAIARQPQPVHAEGQIIKKGKLVYSEITIKATPEKVWDILMNFEQYPNWNPFIRSISGHPEKGERIKARLQPANSKGMNFSPVILQNAPNQELRWIGKLMIPRLFDGEHTFQIQDNGNGTVTFRQYEHFRGLLIPFFKKMLDVDTKASFDLMNQKLKERAEN